MDHGEGIGVYTESTLNVSTLISNSEDLEGLTFDWIHSKIYYASHKRIYVSKEDGTGVQTVFMSSKCESILTK